MIEVALIPKAGHFLVSLVDDVTTHSVGTCMMLRLLLTLSEISQAESAPFQDTNQSAPRALEEKLPVSAVHNNSPTDLQTDTKTICITAPDLRKILRETYNESKYSSASV